MKIGRTGKKRLECVPQMTTKSPTKKKKVLRVDPRQEILPLLSKYPYFLIQQLLTR